MITVNHIKHVLQKESKPLDIKDLTILVNKEFPEIGEVSEEVVFDFIQDHYGMFFMKNLKVEMGNFLGIENRGMDVQNSFNQEALINLFFDDLFIAFSEALKGNGQGQKTIFLHFSTLVLVDRVFNYHFTNTNLKKEIPNTNISLTYNSLDHLKDYRKILISLNQIGPFRGIFNDVIEDLGNERSEQLKKAYSNAFARCLFYSRNLFSPALFGKAFNSYLSNKLLDNAMNAVFTSPNFIGKIIAAEVEVRPGFIVYDPAIGIGSLIVELAHANNCYNFKIIGSDLNQTTSHLCKLNFLINGLTNFNINAANSILYPNIENSKADISICNPPFGNASFSEIDKKEISEKLGINLGFEFGNIFTTLMLQKTNPNGKIIAVVSDGTLFAKPNNIFRQYLVQKDLLEKVIALPMGLFAPSSMMGSNVIFLNKNIDKKKSISFYNGRDTIKIHIKNKRPSFSNEEVAMFINELKPLRLNSGSGKVSIFEKHLGKVDSKMYVPKAFVLKSVVAENGYDLTPARYTHPILSEIAKAKQQDGTNYVTLGSILFAAETSTLRVEDAHWPYLRIKDLNKEGGFLGYDQIVDLSAPIGTVVTSGRLLHKTALLAARVGSDLKATILTLGEDEKAIINNNINVFNVDFEKVHPEYLLAQLQSELVKEQAELFRTKVAAESLSKEKFLNIEIPLLSYSEQLEWVAKNKRKEEDKDELASFIKSIPLIETSQDLKNEIERFSKSQFNNSPSAEFKRYFEYDKFPFSKSEIENFIRIKKVKNNTVTIISLDNDEYGTFGAVEIVDENPIDFKKAQTINEYAAFLTKIYDFLTKSSINKQLDSFAHTSRNFFFKLQGEISLLLDSKNQEFQKIMASTLVETEDTINYYLNKGTKEKDDFILRNQLLSIKEQTAAQYKFYNQIHELYSEIKNAPLSSFYLKNIIDEIKQLENHGLNVKPISKILVFGKQALVKHALVDLVRNAIKYSSDNTCNLEVTDKGNSFVISISNSVNEIMDEGKYNLLGQTWLKDNSDGQDRISSGIYYAFQMVRESHGEASLIDYGNYKHNKIFKVLIQLRKYE